MRRFKCSISSGYHYFTCAHRGTHAHKHTHAQVQGPKRLSFNPSPASPVPAVGPEQCMYSVHIKCQYEAQNAIGTHMVTIQHIDKLRLSVSASRRNYHPPGSIHETVWPKNQPPVPSQTNGETEAQKRKRAYPAWKQRQKSAWREAFLECSVC